jgi:hypothetical protein
MKSPQLVTVALLLVCGGCSMPKNEKPQTDGNTAEITTNSPPSISGTPDSAILAGDVYLFAPDASDADGDPLTFSIENPPRWASFDTSSGRLSGQPTFGDVGLYDGIQIKVSDGVASNSTQTFSVQVAQSANGSMTLSWTPPSENTDGSALTDLAGYFLYYGRTEGNYPNRIRISNPSVSTYLIENLLPSTYYVVATAFNTAGIESSFSGVAVKTVSTL